MERDLIDSMCTLAKNHSSKQIGTLLGVNPNTVKSTLGRLGVKIGNGRGNPKVTAEDIRLMAELKHEDISLECIAEKFGISYSHASRLTVKASKEGK